MNSLLPFEKRNPYVLVKKESDTSMKYGCIPEERKTEELLDYGIIAVDKPSGPSSHQVSAYVQQALFISKSGHSGTLDPKVTGVLPVALGRGTRIVQALLPAGKEYVCLMHLHKAVSKEDLLRCFERFTGKIKQLPPVKSAVKRQYRFRKIYYMDLIDLIGQDVLFRVGCQAGTYIRKLVHDMGVDLKTGAHMSELRRTKAGPFKETDSFTLQDIQDAYHFWKDEGNDSMIRKVILPLEKGVEHLSKIWVLDSTVNSLCHGSDLKVPGISKLHKEMQPDELVAVMTLKEELIAIGYLKMLPKQIMSSEKGVAVKVSKVFMEPGKYPRIDRVD